jgi:hypothetical protein
MIQALLMLREARDLLVRFSRIIRSVPFCKL